MRQLWQEKSAKENGSEWSYWVYYLLRVGKDYPVDVEDQESFLQGFALHEGNLRALWNLGEEKKVG